MWRRGARGQVGGVSVRRWFGGERIPISVGVILVMGEHGTSVRRFRAVADIVFVRPRVRAAARSSRARVHWVREGGTFGELH